MMNVGNRILKIIFVILFIVTLSEVVYYIYFKFNINNTLKQSQPDISTDKIMVSKSIASKNNNKIQTISNTKCPKGFILVPGDKFYDTKDFCVMKYEAKCDINGDGIGDSMIPPSSETKTWNNLKSPCKTITSSPQGWPVTNVSLYDPKLNPYKTNKGISLDNAKKYCEDKGWHVMNNNEYMTIAKNITQVRQNWCDLEDPKKCGLEIGKGVISSGHSNQIPKYALEAYENDNEDNYNTGKETKSGCDWVEIQKRTFALSNDEIIWDIAGNVWEMTDNVINENEQPTAKNGFQNRIGWGWSEFTRMDNYNESFSDTDWYINNYGKLKITDFIPDTLKFDSSYGIGKMTHNSGATISGKLIIMRGGSYEKVSNAGLFTTGLILGPYENSLNTNSMVGFRCVSNPT